MNTGDFTHDEDLRALSGDRYEEVIERARETALGVSVSYLNADENDSVIRAHARIVSQSILRAVLPGLLGDNA